MQSILQNLQHVVVSDKKHYQKSLVIEAIADSLYPDGVESDQQYQSVMDSFSNLVDSTNATITTLSPPRVAFKNRGEYMALPAPVDDEQIKEIIKIVTHSDNRHPRLLFNPNLALGRLGIKNSRNYEGAEKEYMLDCIGKVALADGWQVIEGDHSFSDRYAKPIPLDTKYTHREFFQDIEKYTLDDQGGAPVHFETLLDKFSYKSFGNQYFYVREIDGWPQTYRDLIHNAMIELGYYLDELTYKQQVPSFPDHYIDSYGFSPKTSYCDGGEVVLVSDLRETVQKVFIHPTLSQWQLDEVIKSPTVKNWLTKHGFSHDSRWGSQGGYFPKVMKTDSKPVELCFTSDWDFAVHVIGMVIDDDIDDLVYLHMVGPQQSVKASWAALVSGKKLWVRGNTLDLKGAKNHTILKSKLECGWYEYIFIHHQASLTEINPDINYAYILTDGKEIVPANFIPLLDRVLPIPLLPEWANYLWESGRSQNGITPVNSGEGIGYSAWQVLVNPKAWTEIIKEGFSSGILSI